MNRTTKKILFFFILTVVAGLLSSAPASADPTIQKTPPSAQDTDLSVSPSKGPADAPLEIAVFSCFE